MRWVVILLLLGNVLYWGIYLDSRIEQQARQEKSISVKKIDPNVPVLKLLQEADVLPELRGVAQTTAVEETPEMTVQNATNIADETNQEPGEAQTTNFTDEQPCLLYGPLVDADSLKNVSDWLQENEQPYGTYKTEKSREKQFWVYLEPLESQASAKARIEEFKQMGLKDYALITRGDLKNAISLGVFRNQNSVNRRLAQMQEQGHTPVVVPHYEIEYEYWLYWDLKSPENRDAAENIPDGSPLFSLPRQEIDCRTIAKQLEPQ